MSDHEPIHEPVKAYRDDLKERFRRNAEDVFEELFRKSGVDEAANAKTSAEIRVLQNAVASVRSRLGRLRWGRVSCWIIGLLGVLTGIVWLLPFISADFSDLRIPPWAAGVGVAAAAAAFWLIFGCLNRKIAESDQILTEKEKELADKLEEAFAQLEPLNRLFQWDTVTRIVMKTCPLFTFDKYFSEARMGELRSRFQWQDTGSDDDSVLFCHSGALNGDPFVIGDKLHFRWGEKTYHGSLTISWQEWETYTDSSGKSKKRLVTKHETLHASVTKPFPEYDRKKFIVYGNGAAPDLNFSREPSKLSRLGDGLLDRHRMQSAINNLKKMDNDMKTSFQIMSNEVFDATFGALDRDNEHQFRLLFTVLAQQEMLNVLRDQEQGYGDDFCFRKRRMINTVIPGHLDGADITAAPRLFRHYDLAASRKFFNEYCCEFFRSVYFGFAPLLAIPLYQQNEADHDIFKDPEASEACFWERESAANAYGEDTFRHPRSVTRNILKTAACRNDDGTKTVEVTAYGFRSEPRTDHVSVRGGDGNWHDVPVHWDEYLPVDRTSRMVLRETESSQGGVAGPKTAKDGREWFPAWEVASGDILYRKSLASFIPREE